MITAKVRWIFLLLSLPLSTFAQNARSYDTNDWIPIHPNTEESTKKATGRVLNLDAPSQKFFPDDEYVKKRLQTQHYLRETSSNKGPPFRKQKIQQPYKFENLVPPPPQLTLPKGQLQIQQPQQTRQPPYVQQDQFIQPQYLQQVPQIQPPQPSQHLRAPPKNSPNLYQPLLQPEFNIPFNNSFYQSLNPGVINQELLGAIKNNQNGIPQVPPVVITTTTARVPQQEKENVQLLYVPLENLRPNQPETQQSQTIYRQVNSPREERPVASKTQYYRDSQIQNIEHDFIRQALAAHRLQEQIQLGEPIDLQTTTTTAKPKKRKPHQPPLAVYMGKNGEVNINDVLNVLKQTKSIAVQDSVSPSSPQVFVGPSNLDPPEGYTKFPLPYLSNINGNRIERKVEQLPFFVAPLSYKAPDGYSKIPLPSPHVGSVIVKELHEKNQEIKTPRLKQNFVTNPQFGLENVRLSSYPIPTTTPVHQQEFVGLTGEILPSIPLNSKESTISTYQLLPTRKPQQEYQFKPKEVNNYQDVPTKEFLSNFKLLTETHPEVDYRLPEDSNSQNYQTPTYQIQLPKQSITQNFEQSSQEYRPDSRESTKLPSQSKYHTDIIPSYQIELHSTNNQFQTPTEQNYVTPKQQADYYTFSQAPIRSTTTTESAPKTILSTPKLLEPSTSYTIRDYESLLQQQREGISQNPDNQGLTGGLSYNRPESSTLRTTTPEQTYSQFLLSNGQNQVQYLSSTAQPLSSQYYDTSDYETTTRRSRKRQRVKNTHPTATTTTTTSTTSSPSYRPETYTVLEEFSINPKTTTTQRYTTEVETIPVNVYKLETDHNNAGILNEHEELKQHVLKQDVLDQQILHARPQEQVEPTVRPRKTFEILTENPHSSPLVLNRGSSLADQYLQVQQQQESQQEYVPRQQQQNREQYYSYAQQPQQEQPQQSFQANPYLPDPGLINNLQDQAVRPLLVPNLLVPTTAHLPTAATEEDVTAEVVTPKVTPTEPPKIETTTPNKRLRGRQRATTLKISSTSSPRRNVNRRRPVNTRTTSTTTTERIGRVTSEYQNYQPTRSVSRQRFRTRGRPVQREQTTITNGELYSSQESSDGSQRESNSKQTRPTGVNSQESSGSSQLDYTFKQPRFEGGFQASPGEPNSYMQFEHIINDQEVITVKTPTNSDEDRTDYRQIVVSSQLYSTEKSPEESHNAKPVVDIQITHPITEKYKEPVVLPSLKEDNRKIRINNNIQFEEELQHRSREEPTTKSARVRGRVRSRPRLTSTTSKPTATTVRTTTPRPKQEEEEEEEFYGFIRPPKFNKPAPLVLTTTERTVFQTTPITLIEYEEDGGKNHYPPSVSSSVRPSSPVHFVGEIRPKYPSTTTVEAEQSTEPLRIKARGRVRVPTRRPHTSSDQLYNEVNSPRTEEYITRRSSTVRSRSRGRNHFKLPPVLNNPKTDDEDVEGGNYPAPYLQSQQSTTEVTEKPSFQITVDPYVEEAEEDQEDQESHSSYNSPIVLRNPPQWVEASALPTLNDISSGYKKISLGESRGSQETDGNKMKEELDTEENFTMTTTQPTVLETTTPMGKVVGRRRGVWKLIRHRPIDQFEGAESQNYQSVLNSFEDIAKVKNPHQEEIAQIYDTTTTSIPSSSQTPDADSGILGTLYNMFGLTENDGKKQKTYSTVLPSSVDEITTTAVPPTFPEEYSTELAATELAATTTQTSEGFAKTNSTAVQYDTTTKNNRQSTTTESLLRTYEVEPWNMRKVRTSTSTEISHETEICYKGRCVKTKET